MLSSELWHWYGGSLCDNQFQEYKIPLCDFSAPHRSVETEGCCLQNIQGWPICQGVGQGKQDVVCWIFKEGLFEVVLKILGYTFMQMHAFMSRHIMSLSGIDKEVGLCACLYACVKELQSVLWHYGRIIHAYDNLQLALEVLGLSQQ